MRRVQAYQTTTGKTFDTYEEAFEDELTQKLIDWADSRGICSGGNWSTAMIVECIREDRKELIKIFQSVTIEEEEAHADESIPHPNNVRADDG